MKVIRLSIPFAAGETAVSRKVPYGGNRFALVIKVKIPDCTDTPTATLAIYDLDGDLLFSKASLAENAVTIIHAIAESKDIPLMTGATVTLTFTGAPGAVTPEITFYTA